MRKKSFLLFALFAIVAMAMSGCFKDKGPAFAEVNRSASGILLDQVFPEDTWFSMSFSTLNLSQRENFKALVAKFADNPEAFRDEILKGVDENLQSIDLSYVGDIQPILGEDGFRFEMGMSGGDNGESPVTHAAVTLENPDKGRSLLGVLESKGRFLKKEVNGQTLYFNATAANVGEKVFYFSQYEDVLFMANDETALLEMIASAKSEGGASLWTQPVYQEVVDSLPSESLFSIYLNSGLLNERRDKALAVTGALVDEMPKGILQYLDGQGVAFVATKTGLDFRGIAVGNKKKIDADDATLNELKAGKAYLSENMPADKLALYLESYDFAATLERQLGEGGVASLAGLGLDPSQIDLGKLFGKGYSLAVHRNVGFLPGVSLMVDVSDGKSTASQLVAQLDAQVGGLISLMEFQGGTALSGALTRETADIDGKPFTVIRLNVAKVMEVYQQAGAFSLPSEVSRDDIVLLYGITSDNRFLLSTYDGWLKNPQSMLAGDLTYASTLSQLTGYDEGMVYIKFSELLDFMKTFEVFRKALSADATQIQVENPELGVVSDQLNEAQAVIDALEADSGATEVAPLAEGPRTDLADTPVIAPVDWTELLKPLKSFAFSSKAGKYKVELGGVVVME